MANPEHLAILQQGVESWNAWRAGNREVAPDFSGANLRGANLSDINLSGADLSGADLRSAKVVVANLVQANLRGADLSGAFLDESELTGADLSGANLRGANLDGAYLGRANLSRADLSDANLTMANLSRADLREATCMKAKFTEATLVGTKIEQADLTGAFVYGISAWDLQLTGTVQRDLVITPEDAPNSITVDDLEVAQFIYLLLNNARVRSVIDTITSKVVLILGRFTPERKAVLDALRNELRNRNYLPVLFDFEKPANRDLTETISTLAHMSRFIIADLTDAKSLPQELGRIVPFLPSVPVQPILLASEREWAMYETFPRYPWVLDTVRYADQVALLADISERIIGPAERKAREQISSSARTNSLR